MIKSDFAIKSLDSFISTPGNKVIALDYQTLGFAKIKKSVSEDGKTVYQTLFDNGILDIKKSAEMDANSLAINISEVGKKLYEQKAFGAAAAAGAGLAASGAGVWLAQAVKVKVAAIASKVERMNFSRKLVVLTGSFSLKDISFLLHSRVNTS